MREGEHPPGIEDIPQSLREARAAIRHAIERIHTSSKRSASDLANIQRMLEGPHKEIPGNEPESEGGLGSPVKSKPSQDGPFSAGGAIFEPKPKVETPPIDTPGTILRKP